MGSCGGGGMGLYRAYRNPAPTTAGSPKLKPETLNPHGFRILDPTAAWGSPQLRVPASGILTERITAQYLWGKIPP